MFDQIRRIFWNLTMDIKDIQHGALISFQHGVIIERGDGKIRFGNRVALGWNVIINASDGGEIRIEDNVMIGPNTVIRAANHDPANKAVHIPGRIVIEKGVWIGANCVILPNVTIGENTVIGAGSIVTQVIPSNVFAAGNPCRIKRWLNV